MAVPMACKRCQAPLNSFTMSDGAVEYTHARVWEDHDHEPEPVPVGAVDELVMVCDFCNEPDPVWQYTGADLSHLQVRPDLDVTNNYSPVWSACQRCDDFVASGDVAGLLRFLFDKMKAERPGNIPLDRPDVALQVRQHLYSMQGRYVESITKREPLRTRRAEVRLNDIPPIRMPKVRDRLARFWGSENARAGVRREGSLGEVAIAADDLDMGGSGQVAIRTVPSMWRIDPSIADSFCGRLERSVQVAELYWISKEFTTLAISSGKKLPDITLHREEMPSAHGLLLWQQPIEEIELAGRPVHVIGVSWGVISEGVWFTLYCRPEQAMPDVDLDAIREYHGWLAPVGPGAAIMFGDDLPAESDRAAHFARTILATWFLMNEPGIAGIREEQADKATRRAYGRAGRPQPTVKVVDLRRRPKTAREPAEGVTRTFSVRWEVEGHWYDQAYGPNWSLRRRRFRKSYIKGPDGAPLKLKGDDVQVVKTLR